MNAEARKSEVSKIHTKNMNKDIELAIDNLRRAAGKYSRAERYYRGDQISRFATERAAPGDRSTLHDCRVSAEARGAARDAFHK